MDDLVVTPAHTVPARELTWRFDTSGGPGGQHANRSATRVELRYDLGASEVFEPGLRTRMIEQLGPRARDGVIVVVADSRSQHQNRLEASRRLKRLLLEAMQVPKERKATQPTRAARRRRVQAKRRRGEIKRLRGRPGSE